MIFCTNKRKLGLSGTAVILFYLISLFLTPLFHLHPGESHTDLIADVYHSHAAPFKPFSSEHSEDNHQGDATIYHFSETITLLDDMVGIAQVNPGSIINPSKFPSISDVLIPPTSSESCQNQLPRQNILCLVPPQCQRDYSVLAATNLSPPQA